MMFQDEEVAGATTSWWLCTNVFVLKIRLTLQGKWQEEHPASHSWPLYLRTAHLAIWASLSLSCPTKHLYLALNMTQLLSCGQCLITLHCPLQIRYICYFFLISKNRQQQDATLYYTPVSSIPQPRTQPYSCICIKSHKRIWVLILLIFRLWNFAGYLNFLLYIFLLSQFFIRNVELLLHSAKQDTNKKLLEKAVQ